MESVDVSDRRRCPLFNLTVAGIPPEAVQVNCSNQNMPAIYPYLRIQCLLFDGFQFLWQHVQFNVAHPLGIIVGLGAS